MKILLYLVLCTYTNRDLVSVLMCFPQVAFDTSKHLSELALKRRSLERLKLQELERQREEQKRREKEEEERRKEEERYDGRQKRNGKLVYVSLRQRFSIYIQARTPYKIEIIPGCVSLGIILHSLFLILVVM